MTASFHRVTRSGVAAVLCCLAAELRPPDAGAVLSAAKVRR